MKEEIRRAYITGLFIGAVIGILFSKFFGL